MKIRTPLSVLGLLAAGFSLCVLALSGCGPDDVPFATTKPEVEVCGVQDAFSNLAWLSEQWEEGLVRWRTGQTKVYFNEYADSLGNSYIDILFEPSFGSGSRHELYDCTETLLCSGSTTQTCWNPSDTVDIWKTSVFVRELAQIPG